MTEQRAVEVTQEIEATPEAIFQAIINPLDLSSWFCHNAWTDPKVGGDFLVRWRNGWWARGEYQMVERPWRVALTWKGKDEPGETNLVFKIQTRDRGSLVTATHSGYGADAVWDKAVSEAEQSWPLALDNLASVLEKGIDLREASRPMLGIMPQELTAEQSTEQGIGTENGIYLTSVLENGAAAAAGLQKGDVIISVGGMAVTDLDALTTTLSPHHAGERVHIVYVRGRDRISAVVELKPRKAPEVSFDPQQVVDQAHEIREAFFNELRQAMGGLSEEQAEIKPSANAWSVKEVLAHLSLSERFTQLWLANRINGTTAGQSGGDPSHLPEAFAMTLSGAPTVEALLKRLEGDMQEVLSLFAALRPEVVAMKWRYRTMASALLLEYHYRDHLNQIKETVAAVKG